MKKITNRLFCTLILLCAVGVFAGCSLLEPVVITRESFIGTWEAKFFYFIFYENGTWVYRHCTNGGGDWGSGTWEWDGNKSATMKSDHHSNNFSASFVSHPEEGGFGNWLLIDYDTDYYKRKQN